MKKLEILNGLTLLTLAVSFFFMIKIDNTSRLPIHLGTDYHMNALPFIYMIIFSLLVLVILSVIRIKEYQKKK